MVRNYHLLPAASKEPRSPVLAILDADPPAESSLQVTAALANGLNAVSLETLSTHHPARRPPHFDLQTLCEINDCCLSCSDLGVICYVVM